ncbi:MAG: hypothetical protein ABI700_21440 [Chloroflexota bacterium]
MAQQTEQRIDVREAITNARDYIKFVYEDQKLGRLMLEEVELSEDESKWLITVGFDVAAPPTKYAGISPLIPDFVRSYKIITVDAFDGKVLSMKIRPVNRASVEA